MTTRQEMPRDHELSLSVTQISNGTTTVEISTVRLNPDFAWLDSMILVVGTLEGVPPEDRVMDGIGAEGEYETAVFNVVDGEADLSYDGTISMKKYATEEDARAGHEAMISEWERKLA